MGRWRKGSKELEIKNKLIQRFDSGERVTKAQAIKDYFSANTDYKSLVAQRVVNAIFGSIKRDFRKELQPFGSLNDENEHGIAHKKEEYEFMGDYRYKLVKGIIAGSEIILGDGVKKGLIKGKTESAEIPISNGDKRQLSA